MNPFPMLTTTWLKAPPTHIYLPLAHAIITCVKEVAIPLHLSAERERVASRFSWVILLCFFASGASGLIYQVIWVRMLILTFGSTSFAISAVLTAFLGGLALGSFLFGRRADKATKPLLLYSALEAAVGIYGLLVPLIFPLLAPVYRALWQTFDLSFYGISIVRFLLASLALIAPTALMGGTLPVLSRYYARAQDRLGASVGLLYSINTFGAVFGVAASGFLLIPLFGVKATTLIAAVTNLALALLVLIPARAAGEIGNRKKENSIEAPLNDSARPKAKEKNLARTNEREPRAGKEEALSSFAIKLVLASFALSGFAALTYEVVWSRILTLIIGSSVYAFSIMLTTFLIGLAAGGMIISRFVDRLSKKVLTLCAIQVLTGLSAFAGLYLFPELPYLFVRLYRSFSDSPLAVLIFARFLLAALIIFIPTLLLGAVFPLVVKIYNASASRVGRLVGNAYSINTLGAIAGSFASGFILIPILGLKNTLVLASSLNILLGLALLLAVKQVRRRNVGFAGLCIVLLLAAVISARPAWNVSVMSSGVYRYAPSLVDLNRRQFFERYNKGGDGEAVFYKEGLTATVAVQKQENHFILKVNGKPDASTAGDLPTQTLAGHLPLLFKEKADNALVIGLGSGVTLGSVIQHQVGRVTCVELEQAIVEASHFFDQVNNRPLEDPRVKLVVDDGRNHITITPDRFDVIISEPSNPWLSGVSNLFTQDFFRIGASRLKADGIFCQWVQIYEMPPQDVKTLVRTFHSVFPNVYVFRGAEGDLLLTGSLQEKKIDLELLRRKLSDPKIGADLKRIGIENVHDLLARFHLGPNEIASYTGSGPLNTDDNALIEFQAPKRVGFAGSSTVTANEAELALRAEGVEAYLDHKIVAPIDKANFHLDLALALIKRENLRDASYEAMRSLKIAETARGHSILGEIRLAMGQEAEALQNWRRALELDRRHFNTIVNLAKFYLVKQQYQRAQEYASQALQIDPNSARAHHLMGLSLEAMGKSQEAVVEYRIVERDEQYVRAIPRFFFHLGVALKLSGQFEEAEKYLKRYLETNPKDYEGHYELGQVYAIIGDEEDDYLKLHDAIKQCQRALELKQDFALPHLTLSKIYRRLAMDAHAESELELFRKLSKQQAQ